MMHTPGPWVVEYDGSGRPVAINAPGDDGIPVAVGHVVRWRGIGFPTSEKARANAHLIAAAPTMLAALREIAVIAEEHVHDLCTIVQEGGTLSAVDKMELHRWQSVGEAIAKAEGDKP